MKIDTPEVMLPRAWVTVKKVSQEQQSLVASSEVLKSED